MRTTVIGFLGLLAFASTASAQTFSIDRAEWQAGERRLRVEGNGVDNRTVTIKNAGSGDVLGTTTVDGDEWDRRFRGLTQVPCRVRAEQSGGGAAERDVSNRPANCVAGADAQAPTAPTNLAATAAGSTQINLTWTASTDNVGVTGYRIERCQGAGCNSFTQIATTTGTAATFSNTGLNASTSYSYRVRANDAAGNLSAYSNTASATTATGTPPPDAQAPTAPTNLAATAAGSTQINLTWTASTDNVGVTGYRIERCQGAGCSNFAQVATATGTSFSNAGLNASTSYSYRVRANDAAGNLSPYSNTASATTPNAADTQAPTAPANLAATPAGSTQINLTWTASTDNVGVTGYRIERCAGLTCTNFAEVGTATGTSFSSTGLTANTTYRFRVRANDAAGNLSAYSNIANATTAAPAGDTQAPTAPASLAATAAGSTQINLSWTASTDNVGVTGYRIERCQGAGCANFAEIATATGTSFSNTGLTANTSYSYRVRANDTAGNLSGYSNTASATTGTAVTNCNPRPVAAGGNGNHTGCFTNDLTGAPEYTGPAQCVACHETQARAMHGSLHYQQNGPTTFVTNIEPTAANPNGLAGEGPAGRPVILPNQPALNIAFAINTYCGTHENSPRFTCAGCHVGNGRFPKTPTEFAALGAGTQAQLDELANIDCLMCHQQTYKRFPDWLNSNQNPLGTSEGFADLVLQNVVEVPDPANPGSTILARSVGSTVTRSGLAGIPNVNALTLDFQFRPAGAAGSVLPLPNNVPGNFTPMALTTEQAAETVHPTNRNTCLNCHANAGAADGAKRGDISSANRNSTDVNLDRHMANATGGSNMTCSSCHNAGNHRVRGRGLDLRANDSPTQFTCDTAGCHNATTVHSALTTAQQAVFTQHAPDPNRTRPGVNLLDKISCQGCHIPRYGKGVATEVSRDWQKPHVTQTACNGRGGWLPEEIKSSTATPPVPLTPTYQWFDGTSQVYYLKETLANTPTKPLPANIATAFGMAVNTPAYVLGRPNGGVNTAGAKIYPMKEHWGKLARATANPGTAQNPASVPVNSLIPQSTFEFFRTGSFCRAVAEGLGQNPDTACGTNVQNTNPPQGAEVVAVHTYQTLNHGVEPQANALGRNGTASCGNCHRSSGVTGTNFMDLEAIGYRARPGVGITVSSTNTATCTLNCHGKSHSAETGTLSTIHSRNAHYRTTTGNLWGGSVPQSTPLSVSRCNACHDQITGR